MLSRLFSRFGTKPKTRPSFTRPTVERTDWYVSQPLHFVKFEDKAWGLQWCEQHGCPPNVLQERTRQFDEENTVEQSNALNNMFERAEKGGGFSAIPENTPATHLDNFFTAFKAQPQIKATADLVTMAFSVNRADVAQYVGSLLENNVQHWLDPLLRKPYDDPEMFDLANRAFVQGFQTMMPHPRQMQWLFEHNPSIYLQLNTPDNLAKLEKDIARMSDKEKWMWPLVAHTVFKHVVHPLTSHVASYWVWHDPDAFNTLMLSFAHDPAAQCALMHGAKYMDWFYEHESMTASMENMSPFMAPESIALRNHFQKTSLAGIDDNVIKRLHLLMGLHENTRIEDFYQHARTVFAPAPPLVLDLPEMETKLW